MVYDVAWSNSSMGGHLFTPLLLLNYTYSSILDIDGNNEIGL